MIIEVLKDSYRIKNRELKDMRTNYNKEKLYTKEVY